MLVSGLWHGTTFSFFLFGVVHGFWFLVYRSWDALLVGRLGKRGAKALRARKVVHLLGILITFNATAFTFVFFRVDSAYFLDLVTRLTSP